MTGHLKSLGLIKAITLTQSKQTFHEKRFIIMKTIFTLMREIGQLSGLWKLDLYELMIQKTDEMKIHCLKDTCGLV